MVEFFSEAIVVNVCRYRSWRAVGDCVITSAASFNALNERKHKMNSKANKVQYLDAFCSPSAAMTFARASLAASASAAIALQRKIHLKNKSSI